MGRGRRGGSLGPQKLLPASAWGSPAAVLSWEGPLKPGHGGPVAAKTYWVQVVGGGARAGAFFRGSTDDPHPSWSLWGAQSLGTSDPGSDDTLLP